MLRCIVQICILCIVSGFEFKKPNPKCGTEDYECIAQITKDLLESSIPGIEELGAVSIDPLYHELIEKHLPGSDFYLINSTATGFKDTISNKVSAITDGNSPHKVVQYDITLPHYEMTGYYKLNGKINDIVLEGDGKYEYNATNVHILVDAIREIYDKDSKTYFKFIFVQAKAEVLGNFFVRHHNTGTKALTVSALNFLNENPQLIAGFFQDVVNDANTKKFIEDFNKILATVPADELFTGDNY